MKLAMICGPASFRNLDYWRQSYHLALAQVVLKDSFYAKWFAVRKSRGDFIILDNGVAEGEHLSFQQVMYAAGLIGADEIALLDVMRNGDATVEAHSHTKALVPPRMRMIIPQGSNWDEWLDCLNKLTHSMDFRSIGIPKHLESLEGGRLEALQILMEKRLHLTHDVHLLGCYKAPVKEILEAYRFAPWIRGIDTAAAHAYTQNNQTVLQNEHHSYEWNKVPMNTSLLHKNILALRDACEGVISSAS